MPNVWIAGADMTRIGRLREPLGDLMAVAAHTALRRANRERPDSIVVATMNPEEFLGDGNFASNVATHMGFAEIPSIRVETATSSGAAAFYAGFAQVAADLHKCVLVVGGEKMTHLPTPRVSEIIGRSIDPYERAYGATMPALAGLVTRALMARRGVGVREIAQVAVKNHANAARNPYAHFQQPVTLDEVMESRMVADPLRLLHCCPISDGAAAVVLTAERSAVRVAGIGQGADALAVRHRSDVTHFRATRDAARAAFAMAGFGPARDARRRDGARRAPARQSLRRAQGARPSVGRHRPGAGGRVRVAAHGPWRRAPGLRQGRARALDRRPRDEQLGHDRRGRAVMAVRAAAERRGEPGIESPPFEASP